MTPLGAFACFGVYQKTLNIDNNFFFFLYFVQLVLVLMYQKNTFYGIFLIFFLFQMILLTISMKANVPTILFGFNNSTSLPIIVGPKRCWACRGFSIPVCLCVSVCIFSSIVFYFAKLIVAQSLGVWTWGLENWGIGGLGD